MLSSKVTIAFIALFAQGLAAAAPKLPESNYIGNGTASTTTCSAIRSACQAEGNANQSQCASLAASCCNAADTVCRTAADANMATCSAEKASCYGNANLPDPFAKREEVAVTVCKTTHSTCMATVGTSNPTLCNTLVATCCDNERDVCANRPGVDTAICAAEHAVCYAYFSLPIPV